jgi:hypothetical protein
MSDQVITYCDLSNTGRTVDGVHVLHCATCNQPYHTSRPNIKHKRMCGVAPAPTPEERFVSDVKEVAEKAGIKLPLGDWTAAGLEAIGLTKQRWADWTGGGTSCGGCEGRQKKLNELGAKLAAWLSGG